MQPDLSTSLALVHAPTQAWQSPSGEVSAGIEGFYHGDWRVISAYSILVDGQTPRHVSTRELGAGAALIQSTVDLESSSEALLIERTRRVTAGKVAEKITLRGSSSQQFRISVDLRRDNTSMAQIRQGVSAEPGDGPEQKAELKAPGASRISLRTVDERARPMHAEAVIEWEILPGQLAKGAVDLNWNIALAISEGVVVAPQTKAQWLDSTGLRRVQNQSLKSWVDRALADETALRLETRLLPGNAFLAAGAPWYLTLFGRDSIIAADMMLPLGTDLAMSTLRVLAELQGKEVDQQSGEQPGKIMHELRASNLVIEGEGLSLPPLYYGTIDATPLWINLLVNTWRAGASDAQLRTLVPNLVAALEWMRDFGDADGDGFLEYHDATGKGLANQGWKDSPSAIQWQDGTLAEGPVALCEVQGYAYKAAMGGADLLDHLGVKGAEKWRLWAQELSERFRAQFWISAHDGGYPAIALDGTKRAVDVVASNMGHLLGTGLLTGEEEALVAQRLISPALNSGLGLRTMSAQAAGYDPLSYHCGSVWAHDTAIAIRGLAGSGFTQEALELATGLLNAATAFDFRMPELFSGEPGTDGSAVAYSAACRPQAWSGAAAIAVMDAVGVLL